MSRTYDDFDVCTVPGTDWKGKGYSIQSFFYRNHIIKIVINAKTGVVGWILTNKKKFYGAWFDLDRVDRRHVSRGMQISRDQSMKTLDTLLNIEI